MLSNDIITSFAMPFYTAAGIKKSACPTEPASRPKTLTPQTLKNAVEALKDPITGIKPSTGISIKETVIQAFQIIDRVYEGRCSR